VSDLIHPDDYDIDAVRAEWIGKVVSQTEGRFPVEYDPIRRHCHMTGDTNPLFLDPEFARDVGPHGEVVVPPSLLPTYFASGGPWPKGSKKKQDASEKGAKKSKRPFFTLGVPTPGDRGINMGTEWEFLAPIRVGDRLRAEQKVTDVFIKATRMDEKSVWIKSAMTFSNQNDEPVAVWHNTTLVHRSPKQIKQDNAREVAA